MSKTSFEKVEQYLDRGLRRLFVEKLRDEADNVQRKKRKNPIPRPPWEEEDAEKQKEQKERVVPKLGKTPSSIKNLRSLIQNLKRASMYDSQVYIKLKVNQKRLKGYLREPAKMTADDWHLVNDLQERLAEFEKSLPMEAENEDLIKLHRLNQKNARFNVRSEWLPL